jgi:hypothetical protein
MPKLALAVLCICLAAPLACAGSSKSSAGAGAGAGAGTGTAGGESSHAGASAGGSTSGGESSAGGSHSSGGSADGGSSNGGVASGGAPPWEKWSACSVADDCTVIPISTCCGCSATGVNQMYEKEARASNASFNVDACPPLGCFSPPCPPDSMVACEMGRCVPKPGCSERNEQSCESDGRCQKYQARNCATAGAFAYFACGKPKGACAEVATCRLSPSAQQMLFPDGCVPDGYTQTCPSQCK